MSRAQVEVRQLRCPVVTDAFRALAIEYTDDDPAAPLVWWDGLPPAHAFELLRPGQRANKIPLMDQLCYKSALFQALTQMQTLFPGQYGFFPRTLILPHQCAEFQRLHMRLRTRSDAVTWILKPECGCCGIGIRLLQQPLDVVNDSSPAIVQLYVAPWLVDGFKFDFRFYLLISDLHPLTLFLYGEGIARFCTKKYRYPTRQNLSERFCHLTNTAVNIENATSEKADYTRPASEILAELRIENLWAKIRNVCALTILAIYPQMITGVLRHSDAKQGAADPFHKYFHILGIDILINEAGEPIVLELNDRPSMKVTFPFERGLKRGLIIDAMSIVNAGDAPSDRRNKWEQLLPADDSESLSKMIRAIQQRSLNVFGPRTTHQVQTVVTKPVVYPRPPVDKSKLSFRSYRYPFQ